MKKRSEFNVHGNRLGFGKTRKFFHKVLAPDGDQAAGGAGGGAGATGAAAAGTAGAQGQQQAGGGAGAQGTAAGGTQQNQQQTTTGQAGAQGQQQAGGAGGAGAGGAKADDTEGDGKVIAGGTAVTMPTKQLKKIKEREQLKGANKLKLELDTKAKADGFDSHDAALAFARDAKKKAAAGGATGAAADGSAAGATGAAGSAAALALQQQLRDAQRKNEELENRMAAAEVGMQLRGVAHTAGIKDVDYALHLFEKELGSKTQEQLATFDEAAFFTGLRTKHPYLFGETITPATTGTAGTQQAPQTPGATQTQQQQAAAGKVDARKMSPQQWAEYKRAKGLS
jgi:hypothetical protein